MYKFSPSVNLTRDSGQEIQYIPTANTRRIYNQLLADYSVGIHAFSVIGSYGTGKSAFLLALNGALNGDQRHFPSPNGHLGALQGVDFINIVGSYGSIRDALGQHLRVPPNDDLIFEGLLRAHEASRSLEHGLAIVIDEFGKFLEYAAHSNPEGELYFVQKLAELVNDPARNFMLVTVLHQNFSTYGARLSREQREEWEKVKGRFKELTFNEPVEQLLELAADFTKNGHRSHSEKELAKLVQTIDLSAAFPHRHRLSTEFAAKLLPFDILSASVLTQALQRYGQNERSLFTFLNANDYRGINDYDTDEHPYYNLVCVYDYLAHNYESLLNSVHNPHYTQWGVIRRTQERAEAELEAEHVGTAFKLIKVIGLLNIFAPDGARINPTFLSEYGDVALGVENVTDTLAALENRKLIRYIRFKDSFVLYEGTDLNIELELLEAEGKVEALGDTALHLREHFEFPLVLAKAVSFRKGTPRFFKFRLSDEPIVDKLEAITDGTINLVFANEIDFDVLSEISEQNPTVLYGIYQNTSQIRQALLEIKKIDHVLSENQDDQVGKRELERLKAEEIDQLNQLTLDSLYDGSILKWVWQGGEVEVKDRRGFNSLLSQICDAVYTKTPIFRNELVNKHKVSSAVATARRNYFRALADKWQSPDLGFPAHRFPAEKGIYLTLLQETGIHRQEEGQYVLDEPTEPSFRILWNACEEFLKSAKATPRDLNQLVEILNRPPFKLKEGFLNYWIPTFVFAKREELALYHNSIYVPEVTLETLDLIQKEPQKVRVKSFTVDGVRLRFFNRFRELVQQSPSENISNRGFIETIRPFLTFYRSLPPYAQQTSQLNPETIRLREVIAKATDPEKTFFEDFPLALGFDNLAQEEADDESLEAFVDQLQKRIRELRTCYDEQVNRVERFLLDILGASDSQFPSYRDEMVERYATLRPNELLPRQRTLLIRLTSALDDRDAWLNSVAQAVLGRDIRRMRDGDEELLFSKLRMALQELDNLCQLDELNADPEKEVPPVAIEITTTQTGSHKLLHRLPRRKEVEVSALEARLREQLTEDESVNAGALIRLLQEMIEDE